MATFDDYDLVFEYPDNWELEVDGDASERTITLQSPDSAFWVMRIFDEPISTLAIVQQAADAFVEEYEGADVESEDVEILGFPTDARLVDFSCLDLIGQARVEAFATHRRTFFLMGQRSDVDGETADDVFEAIRASLKLPTE